MKLFKNFKIANNKQLKTYTQLFENVSDIVYHNTYTHRIYQILKNNTFNLSPVFGSRSDLEINGGFLYTLSLTTTRSADLGYAKRIPNDGIVRVTLDGRKINQNFKTKRVDYWGSDKNPNSEIWDDMGDIDKKSIMMSNDEMEERILSNNSTIKNANKYISCIDILNANKEYTETIKYYCDKLDIQFNAYDSKKYFNQSLSSKAIKVKSIDHKIEIKEDPIYSSNSDIIYYMIYKNDKLKKEIYSYIKNNFNDRYNTMIKDVEKFANNKKYYMSYYDEFRVNDLSRSLSSNIHNNKKSNNKYSIYLLGMFAKDMKKNNTSTIQEYLKYKIYIGKKTQQDFNEEFNNNMIKVIDDAFKNNIDIEAQYLRYNSDGYSIESFDGIPIYEFYEKIKEKIKKFVSDYILNNNDMYKYHYVLNNNNLKSEIDFDFDSNKEYDELLKYFNESQKDEYIEDFKRITDYAISDISRNAEDKISDLQEENINQWKS